MAFFVSSKISNIQFKTLPCCQLSEDEIKQCKNLFDNHYGIWGSESPKAGQRIRFPLKLYHQYCDMEDTFVAVALDDQKIIGQAFYIKRNIDEKQPITWVLQLVVHTEYRMRGIAKTLLYSIWGFSDCYGWGLATSNALTVKTLEKATFRKVKPEVMAEHYEQIIMIKETIPFAQGGKIVIEKGQSILDSGFPVDRAVINKNLQLYEGRWELGELPAGHE